MRACELQRKTVRDEDGRRLGRLDELHIRHSYYEYPGGHTWPVWRNDLYHFAQLLFNEQTVL